MQRCEGERAFTRLITSRKGDTLKTYTINGVDYRFNLPTSEQWDEHVDQPEKGVNYRRWILMECCENKPELEALFRRKPAVVDSLYDILCGEVGGAFGEPVVTESDGIFTLKFKNHAVKVRSAEPKEYETFRSSRQRGSASGAVLNLIKKCLKEPSGVELDKWLSETPGLNQAIGGWILTDAGSGVEIVEKK